MIKIPVYYVFCLITFEEARGYIENYAINLETPHKIKKVRLSGGNKTGGNRRELIFD